MTEAKQVIEGWRREYNDSRPHRSLGRRTPSEFAWQIALKNDLPGSQTVGNSLEGVTEKGDRSINRKLTSGLVQ